MKKLVWLLVLVLLLSGCSVREPEETQSHYTHDIYELTFKTRKISNNHVGNEWSFTYTYNGETITTGHQIRFSLGIFTFHSIQVDVIAKAAPGNTYSATFPVAICRGGTGKTELTVTDSDGTTATFKITCLVTQIGKQ